MEEFYQIAKIKNAYDSLDELHNNLDQFIQYYDFKRMNPDYRLGDKIRYQKFTDGKRKCALLEPI